MHDSFHIRIPDILIKVKLKGGKNCPVGKKLKLFQKPRSYDCGNAKIIRAAYVILTDFKTGLYLASTMASSIRQDIPETGRSGRWLLSAPCPGIPVLLKAGRPESAHAVAFDQSLPGHELFNGQAVALARRFERQQAGANRKHHDGLTPDHPTLRVGWRQVSHGYRFTVGTDNHRIGCRAGCR